jgi:hypothetical protein
MKKLNFHPSALQIIYLIIYMLLFLFIVYVPTLISGPVRITDKLIIEEEIIEGSLLGILLVLNIVTLNLYKKEADKQKEIITKINKDKIETRERLVDSSRYIGQLNVQIQEIKTMFKNNVRFPETKNDFKKSFAFFSERVLGIVNANWVLFRIINCDTLKTIIEQLETRPGYITNYPHIGNKMIVENGVCPPFTSIISSPENSDIISCCILPVDDISNDERILIQAITNEISMMFAIFNYSSQVKINRISSSN